MHVILEMLLVVCWVAVGDTGNRHDECTCTGLIKTVGANFDFICEGDCPGSTYCDYYENDLGGGYYAISCGCYEVPGSSPAICSDLLCESGLEVIYVNNVSVALGAWCGNITCTQCEVRPGPYLAFVNPCDC